MNYKLLIDGVCVNWQIALQENEWYFTDFREKLITNISDSDIEQCINYLSKIIVREENEYLLSEYLETLYVLCKKYNSTKIPIELEKNMSFLNKISEKSEYLKTLVKEIKIMFLIVE